jgi:hypothetical protein
MTIFALRNKRTLYMRIMKEPYKSLSFSSKVSNLVQIRSGSKLQTSRYYSSDLIDLLGPPEMDLVTDYY